MQDHPDGFQPGDPSVPPPEPRGGDMDALIVGCGPAGLTLAAQPCVFPDITTRIVERKRGPGPA